MAPNELYLLNSNRAVSEETLQQVWAEPRDRLKGKLMQGLQITGCSVVKVVRREESVGEDRLRSPFIPAR